MNSSSPERPFGTSRRATVVWGLGGWLAVLFAVHGAVILSGLRLEQGDWGDARFVNFLLEHGWRWVHQAPLHQRFWDLPIFWPAVTNSAAYSEVLLGTAPLYWPWRALGLPADSAMQLWALCCSSLNFVAAFAMIRVAFGRGALAASFGALLFAAGAPRVAQLNHPQLLAQFFLPVAVLALALAFREPRRERRAIELLVFFLACVGQLYACFYWGWFQGFLFGLAALVAGAIPTWRSRLVEFVRTNAGGLLAGLGLSALLLVPLGRHYLRAAHLGGTRSWGDLNLPQVQSLLFPGPGSWLYGWMDRLSLFQRLGEGRFEQQLRFGLLSLGLAVAGLLGARRWPAVRLLGLTSVVFILLLLEYRWKLSPWWLVYRLVPGANALRAAARGGMFLLLPGAVGLAFFLDRRRPGWAALLGLACLAEQLQRPMTFDKQQVRAWERRVAAAVPRKSCQAFFYAPSRVVGPPWQANVDAVMATLWTGLPTVNGYSGKAPPGYPFGMELPPAGAWVRPALAAWLASTGHHLQEVCVITLDPSLSAPSPPPL